MNALECVEAQATRRWIKKKACGELWLTGYFLFSGMEKWERSDAVRIFGSRVQG